MGEVVNLRLQRKRAARRLADVTAAENRAVHGLSKAAREIAERGEATAAQRLDGHRLDAGPTIASADASLLADRRDDTL